MSNGNIVGGSDSGSTANANYTLQGVMHFLQMEWHNHERARNAWDIEKAEMKVKIAKQEGNYRQAKKMNDQLDRRIRMLELVLKKERTKGNTANSGTCSLQAPQDDSLEIADSSSFDGKNSDECRITSKTSVNNATSRTVSNSTGLYSHEVNLPEDKGALFDKSWTFLIKAVEEITYLLSPGFSSGITTSGSMNRESDLSGGSIMLGDQGQQDLENNLNSHLRQPRTLPQTKLAQTCATGSLSSSTFSGFSSDVGLKEIKNCNSWNTRPRGKLPDSSGSNDSKQSLGNFSYELLVKSRTQASGSNSEYSLDKTGELGCWTLPPFGKNYIRGDWQGLSSSGSGSGSSSVSGSSGWDLEDRDKEKFPQVANIPERLSSRSAQKRKSGSTTRKRSEGVGAWQTNNSMSLLADNSGNFKVRYALRGHLDVIRCVIFSGGGYTSEFEICTGGDDGLIKRWTIPESCPTYSKDGSWGGGQVNNSDIDICSFITHRGHGGSVTSLTSCIRRDKTSGTEDHMDGGWIFSGGQDGSIRLWGRNRVDCVGSIAIHFDAIWGVTVLGVTYREIFQEWEQSDGIVLASGSSDGTIKVWGVRFCDWSGDIGWGKQFDYKLIHSIDCTGNGSACLTSLTSMGRSKYFVASYSDASVIVYDGQKGKETVCMDSRGTYDGTRGTGVNAVAAIIMEEGGTGSLAGSSAASSSSAATASPAPVNHPAENGLIITGHENRYIRFFEAQSGRCIDSILGHTSSVSCISAWNCGTGTGAEAVTGGHDGSLRFWNVEKRMCVQEMTSHRVMRGEGVCCVAWSGNGRLVVSGGGDGVAKVYSR